MLNLIRNRRLTIRSCTLSSSRTSLHLGRAGSATTRPKIDSAQDQQVLDGVYWRTESVPRLLRQSILLRRFGCRHTSAYTRWRMRNHPLARLLPLFFFAPPDHDLRDILFIQIFGFLSILERLEITGRRSYSSTRSYYWQMMYEASTMLWLSEIMVQRECSILHYKIYLGISATKLFFLDFARKHWRSFKLHF